MFFYISCTYCCFNANLCRCIQNISETFFQRVEGFSANHFKKKSCLFGIKLKPYISPTFPASPTFSGFFTLTFPTNFPLPAFFCRNTTCFRGEDFGIGNWRTRAPKGGETTEKHQNLGNVLVRPMSNGKKNLVGWVGFGEYTTQVYRVINHEISIPISNKFFFFVARMVLLQGG